MKRENCLPREPFLSHPSSIATLAVLIAPSESPAAEVLTCYARPRISMLISSANALILGKISYIIGHASRSSAISDHRCVLVTILSFRAGPIAAGPDIRCSNVGQKVPRRLVHNLSA